MLQCVLQCVLHHVLQCVLQWVLAGRAGMHHYMLQQIVECVAACDTVQVAVYAAVGERVRIVKPKCNGTHLQLRERCFVFQRPADLGYAKHDYMSKQTCQRDTFTSEETLHTSKETNIHQKRPTQETNRQTRRIYGCRSRVNISKATNNI